MVLPTEVEIKREIDDLESNSNLDIMPEECFEPEYEIKVEIEMSGTHLGLENEVFDNPVYETCSTTWSIKEELISSEASYPEDWVCYDQLLYSSKHKCSSCNEMFIDSYSLLRHNLKHLKLQLPPLDLQSHECTVCNQYYYDTMSLKEHVQFAHRKKKKDERDKNENFKITEMLHQCKLCGKIQNYKNWHSHMREVHTEDRRFECSTCNTTFKCLRYLRNHMKRTHQCTIKKKTEDASVSCQLCPAKLKCKNALKTHIRNCHSEKVQCDVCKSVLKSQAYLYAHMRRVHYVDGKEHRCKCGKNFRSERYLRVHVKLCGR